LSAFSFLAKSTEEVAMFARSVSFHLKPGRTTEFTQTLEKDIIPVLRKQKGFQDEIAFVGPNGTDAVGISLWDLKENAEYHAAKERQRLVEARAAWQEEAASQAGGNVVEFLE